MCQLAHLQVWCVKLMYSADTSRGANEAWMSRQALQDVYQRLLVMDLEYALDKKIEQEL